jgi:hypothetical protein
VAWVAGRAQPLMRCHASAVLPARLPTQHWRGWKQAEPCFTVDGPVRRCRMATVITAPLGCAEGWLLGAWLRLAWLAAGYRARCGGRRQCAG